MSANLYDVWMPSLGPSEQLLKAVQSGGITWAAFTRDFTKELFLDGAIDARNRTIKNPRPEVHAAADQGHGA
jgi:uncharacterized protein YeaO (DUF488 family)